MAKESWKPVVGYEGTYEVSDLGNVRSLDREVPLGRWPGATQSVKSVARPPRMQPNGYWFVSLRKPRGHRKHHLLHRLVLMAFIGQPPDGHEANHKDLNKSNNKLANLEWVTASENQYHQNKMRRDK